MKKNPSNDNIVKGEVVLTPEEIGALAVDVFTNRSVNMTDLSPELQKALENYDVRELVGIAPAWKPAEIGQYIVGQVITARTDVGPYKSMVLTFDTPEGPRAVWLSADLLLKFGSNPDVIPGRNFVVKFEGWITQAEVPSLKKAMRSFRVLEVGGRRPVEGR